MKQLEEIFQSRILTMLKRKGKIVDDLIQKRMNWHHSGFSVYAGNRIARDVLKDERRTSNVQHRMKSKYPIPNIQRLVLFLFSRFDARNKN
jgi:hypothetical protein